MPIQSSLFSEKENIYIDYPYEEVMFHWIGNKNGTVEVLRKFYGKANEDEVHYSNNLFCESESSGNEISAEQYLLGKPRRTYKTNI